MFCITKSIYSYYINDIIRNELLKAGGIAACKCQIAYPADLYQSYACQGEKRNRKIGICEIDTKYYIGFCFLKWKINKK